MEERNGEERRVYVGHGGPVRDMHKRKARKCIGVRRRQRALRRNKGVRGTRDVEDGRRVEVIRETNLNDVSRS